MMKVKPFYIKYHKNITDELVAEVFDKAVAAGARLDEGVEGIHEEDEDDNVNCYPPKAFAFFGVDRLGETYFNSKPSRFGQDAIEITLDQVDEWLGIAPKQKPNDNEFVISKWDRLADVLPNRNDGSMSPLGVKGVVTVKLRDDTVPGQLVCHPQFDAVQSPTVAERMAALIEKYKHKIKGWARWACIDQDGEFCAFQYKPERVSDCFTRPVLPYGFCGLLAALPEDDYLVKNWRETLTELPTVKQGLIVENKPVWIGVDWASDQEAMKQRDERECTPKEAEVMRRVAAAEVMPAPRVITIPSICLQDQAMPMMLGGEHGGRHG